MVDCPKGCGTGNVYKGCLVECYDVCDDIISQKDLYVGRERIMFNGSELVEVHFVGGANKLPEKIALKNPQHADGIEILPGSKEDAIGYYVRTKKTMQQGSGLCHSSKTDGNNGRYKWYKYSSIRRRWIYSKR